MLTRCPKPNRRQRRRTESRGSGGSPYGEDDPVRALSCGGHHGPPRAPQNGWGRRCAPRSETVELPPILSRVCSGERPQEGGAFLLC
jgi:hypothetical protein